MLYKSILVSADLGDKLKELLIKHGDMKKMEVAVSKWVKKTKGEGKRGKWVTKTYLEKSQFFTPTHFCM